MIDQVKIKVIEGRAEASINAVPGQYNDAEWNSKKQCAEDVLYLLQVIELQATQIEMLCAPEHIRSLMKRFGELTQTRKALILELMREMKEVQHDQQN